MSETPTPTTTPSGYTAVTEGGVTVTSTSESAEQITESLKPEPDLSEAGATLGKKGGEAAAAKRREAKEQDEQGANAETRSGGPGSDIGADSPDDAAPAKGEQAKPLGKPRDDPRARMLEATRKEAEAKRERDQVKAERDRYAAELEQLRAGRATEQFKLPQPTTGGDARPQQGDFEDWDEFRAADTRWLIRQELKEHQQTQARAQSVDAEIAQNRTKMETFLGRLGKHAETDPTFKPRTLQFVGSLQPSFMVREGGRFGPINTISDRLFESEHAPALTAHFVDNPAEFERIASLTREQDVLYELAKLEISLGAASTVPAPVKAAVSQAKPPVRPVSGSGHVGDSGPPGDDAPYDVHRAYYIRKDREKAASGR